LKTIDCFAAQNKSCPYSDGLTAALRIVDRHCYVSDRQWTATLCVLILTLVNIALFCWSIYQVISGIAVGVDGTLERFDLGLLLIGLSALLFLVAIRLIMGLEDRPIDDVLVTFLQGNGRLTPQVKLFINDVIVNAQSHTLTYWQLREALSEERERLFKNAKSEKNRKLH